MKKLILLTALFAVLCAINPVFGASSQVETHTQFGSLHELTIDWTAHTTGAYTSYLITNDINGTVYCVVTDPGATAPQALYDITLTDQYGRDIMGGSLANRSATVTETAQPYVSDSASYVAMPVRGRLTLAITGNNVNTAIGSVIIYYFRD